MISRRRFIKTLSGTAMLLSAPKLLHSCSRGPKSLKDFGIQLYTLRDVMPSDPVAIIRAVAKMGYTQIESYEGPQGMFWGMSNLEFANLMTELDMKIVSSHIDITEGFEQKVIQAAEIGMSHLVCPWIGAQKSIDEYKQIADDFNAKGRICREHGIRFAYHNHAYSFETLENQIPQDVLMENTDPDLVDFEMDIYWVVTAGHDPVEWLKRYPTRWRLGHVKDRKKNVPATETDATCVLGTGTIDWPVVLKHAVDEGMEYFLVEQEQYDDMSSTEAARQNAVYLKKLRF